MRVSLVLLAACSACLTAGAAHAQALSVPAGADFSGVDLGVDLGAGIGASGGVNTSGMAAGAHVGYNLQNGPIVGGVVGNILFGNISGGGPNSVSFSENSLASLRARGGYEMGNLLLFGSVGWGALGFALPGLFRYFRQMARRLRFWLRRRVRGYPQRVVTRRAQPLRFRQPDILRTVRRRSGEHIAKPADVRRVGAFLGSL